VDASVLAGSDPEPQDRIRLLLLGTRVDVAVHGSGAGRLAASLARAWCFCRIPRGGQWPTGPGDDSGIPGPAITVEAFLDADPAAVAGARASGMVADRDVEHLLDQLSTRLTVAAIGSRRGELWMLHACAVADPVSGASIALVGPSGTGKTTAALALGRHLAYLTDETAATTPVGAVIPYPKPLSVLVAGRRPKRQVSPRDLGLLPPAPAPRLAAIALLDRTGSRVPRVEVVRTVEALPALAAQSSGLQALARPLHVVAGLLERTGGLRRVTYREAGDLLPVVEGLLGRRS